MNLGEMEKQINELKERLKENEETIVLNTCREILKPYCPIRVADLDQIEVNNKKIDELKKKGEKLEGKLSEWNKIMNISIMNDIDKRIRDLKKITDAQVIVNKDHSTGFNNLEEALRDALENKEQNAEKHLAELVDDPQIEARFIKACEKQIEDAERQLEKLDSDPVQDRIDRLDAGFNILKKHEEGLKDVIPKQAEKTEIPSENLRTCSECQKIFESIKLRKNHEFLIHGIGEFIKDSGGEKEERRRMNRLPSAEGLKGEETANHLKGDDSKLFDPIALCKECKYHNDLYNNEICLDCDELCNKFEQKEKTEPEKFILKSDIGLSQIIERVRDATRKELIDEFILKLNNFYARHIIHHKRDSEIFKDFCELIGEYEGMLKE